VRSKSLFRRHTAGPSAKTLGAIVSNVWAEFAGGVAPAAAAAHAAGAHAASGSSPANAAAAVAAGGGGGVSSSSSNSRGSSGGSGCSGWAAGKEGVLEVLLLELEYGQVDVLPPPTHAHARVP
jgi:hypothetical protein